MANFISMVARTLHPEAVRFWPSCSCVCRFWSKLPLWGTHTQGGKQATPNCSETTAVSGRIFPKPSSPLCLLERMMSPKEDGGSSYPRRAFQERRQQPSLICLPAYRHLVQQAVFLARCQPLGCAGDRPLCFSRTRKAVCAPALNSETPQLSPSNPWLPLATKNGF